MKDEVLVRVPDQPDVVDGLPSTSSSALVEFVIIFYCISQAQHVAKRCQRGDDMASSNNA
jgi:hypothetical protein